MVVAAIPISGAVDDQNTNQNSQDPTSGLSVGVTNDDIQEAQNVIQTNKPFGENSSKILGTNNSDGSLRVGSNGEDVKKLQQWLTDYGYYAGDVDGVFGADTETAVKAFQEEAGLIVDGVVGKDTKKAMENWDKYVAEVQAAGESDSSSSSNQASYSSSQKKSYASAVRSYSRSYRYTGWSGSGDCWDISDAAYNRLTASGQRARIIQYANSYVGNHRSVQTWNGNTWVDYYGVAKRGVPTSRKGSETVIKG